MKLKLYVWEEVLTDWTSGVVFALANNPEEAIKALKKAGLNKDRIDGIKVDGVLPEEVTTVKGFLCWGGG
jgi:hypothetical protein